jgi:hypothetical protein
MGIFKDGKDAKIFWGNVEVANVYKGANLIYQNTVYEFTAFTSYTNITTCSPSTFVCNRDTVNNTERECRCIWGNYSNYTSISSGTQNVPTCSTGATATFIERADYSLSNELIQTESRTYYNCSEQQSSSSVTRYRETTFTASPSGGTCSFTQTSQYDTFLGCFDTNPNCVPGATKIVCGPENPFTGLTTVYEYTAFISGGSCNYSSSVTAEDLTSPGSNGSPEAYPGCSSYKTYSSYTAQITTTTCSCTSSSTSTCANTNYGSSSGACSGQAEYRCSSSSYYACYQTLITNWREVSNCTASNGSISGCSGTRTVDCRRRTATGQVQQRTRTCTAI